jgi:hypothetical protein
MPRSKPQRPPKRRAGFHEPLVGEERTRLVATVDRLKKQLLVALDDLGDRARPSELERTTSLGRATVHRVLALARAPRGSELESFRSAPGFEALEAFSAAIRGKRSAKSAGELDLAIAQFRKAVSELGGSKSLLNERVRASTRTETGDPTERARRELETRQALFRDVAELLGRQSDARLDAMFFRPSEGDPDVLDLAQVRGIFGYRARLDALPLSVDLLGRATRPTAAMPELLDLDGRPAAGALSNTVLAEFSTSPPPIVLSQGLGDRVRNIVDPAVLSRGSAVDFVVGFQRKSALVHPRNDEVPTLEVGALHRDPARHLVVDVWLHRSLAAGAIADLATYVWSPTLETSLADHWTDRLPTTGALSVLGQGLARARSSAIGRLDELTSHVFSRLGWDALEFVGYRAEIDYPLFGGAYFATFDYGTWLAPR